MVVITVKYDGETYVSKPLEDKDANDIDSWVDFVKQAADYFQFPLHDGKIILMRSEAIKRSVFLFEEVAK